MGRKALLNRKKKTPNNSSKTPTQKKHVVFNSSPSASDTSFFFLARDSSFFPLPQPASTFSAAGKGTGCVFSSTFDQFQELSIRSREPHAEFARIFEKYYVGEICGSFWRFNRFTEHICWIFGGGTSNKNEEKEPLKPGRWWLQPHLINIS